MTLTPRPEVQALTEAIHGAIDAAELAALGIDPRTVLDFSASINPHGPSPRVIEAIERAAIDTYPDRDCTELRGALAAHLNVSPVAVIAGNGSSELVQLVALAYLRPDDPVIVVGPTYSEYARASKLMGARVIACDAVIQNNFEFPLSLTRRALEEHRPRAVFLCHPNNPTGTCLPNATLCEWMAEFTSTLFVVDEAYIEFAPLAKSFVGVLRDNLLVLRSLTKAHGLAGLRVGYAVAAPEVIAVLERVRPPWSVNAVAQVAAVAALADQDYVRQSVDAILAEKERMLAAFRELDERCLPSEAHYFLVACAFGSSIRRELLESRILVRDCTSFGLGELIRISPRSAADNDALLAAYRELLRRLSS